MKLNNNIKAKIQAEYDSCKDKMWPDMDKKTR